VDAIFDRSWADALWALAQVLLINVVLSADNAVVVGMAVTGLPADERSRAIWLGIAAATVLRVIFAVVATQLLQLLGLVLAGGFLLLWVAWKLWRDVAGAGDAARVKIEREGQRGARSKSFRQALARIVLADISMSLDNVLAVAGAAIGHPMILIVGLALSVFLMGAAAVLVAKLLERHHWLAYIGLLVVVYVALHMIWTGANEVADVIR
jgi:YjbE family integral membrane protein